MIRLLTNIKPRYIILLSVGVAVMMLSSAYIELRQSRLELFHVLEEHSRSLAQSVVTSSENVVLSSDRIESQISERLLNNARLIALIDSLGSLNAPMLDRIVRENGIFRVNVFDQRGRRIISNRQPEQGHGMMPMNDGSRSIIARILSGEEREIVMGLKESRFGNGYRYAVAVRRSASAGGAIVLNVDAGTFVEFRKQIGIGKLVKDLEKNSGIDYVVIQDTEGILAATPGVREMSAIMKDTVLRMVLDLDTTITRQVPFNEHSSFEVIKRLSIDGTAIGVLRIGLSMDELRSIDDRMLRRIIVMSVVMIFLAVLLLLIVVSAQNFRLISGKYSAIRSITGNILEHMNDAVVSFDHEGRLTLFNRQAETLFGQAGSALLGRSPNAFPEDLAEVINGILSLPDGDHERTLVVAGERERIVSISISSAEDDHASSRTRTMVIKDLTEAKQMQQQIQRNEKMSAMGELAAGVAHEIRNPLNAISMIAQRFEKEFVPKRALREYRTLTAVLKDESTRINSIVRQFLRYARPKNIQLQSVTARAFGESIAALFRSQALQKKVTFLLESEEIPLMTDTDLMTQACLNLLQNALDATPAGGTILLTLKKNPEKQTVEISIADTGSGIPEELKERIFDLYFTTKSHGTGMGLAITQQIIAQHSGSIRILNNHPTGTVFSISLPAQYREMPG